MLSEHCLGFMLTVVNAECQKGWGLVTHKTKTPVFAELKFQMSKQNEVTGTRVRAKHMTSCVTCKDRQYQT